ncbi:23832_t:CDS:2, partial [Cetraspora pellucida]
ENSLNNDDLYADNNLPDGYFNNSHSESDYNPHQNDDGYFNASHSESDYNTHQNDTCTNPVLNIENLSKTCDFYTSCIENKFHCGNDGYPLAYGFKYCNRFASSLNLFSDAGKKWVVNTIICLQRSLVSTYENDASTCSDIMNIAYISHTPCYIANGLCDISQDWYTLFKVIDAIDLFGSYQALKQALNVGGNCLQLVTWLDENESDTSYA